MCISPHRKKNRLGEFVDYPCGKCFECVRKRKLDWEIRMNYALQWSDCAFFTLLSFDEEHYPANPYDKSENIKRVQDFVKRLRKRLNKDYGSVKLKYFIATEFGEEKNRLHYHCCFFLKGVNITWRDFNSLIHSYKIYNFETNESFFLSHSLLTKASYYLRSHPKAKMYEPVWPFGYVGNSYNLKMCPAKIRYTCKYIQKQYNSKVYSRFSMSEIAPDFASIDRSLLDPFEYENDLPNLKSSCELDKIARKLTTPHFGKNVPLPNWWIRLLIPNSSHRSAIFSNLKENIPELSLQQIRLKYFLQCNFENTLT